MSQVSVEEMSRDQLVDRVEELERQLDAQDARLEAFSRWKDATLERLESLEEMVGRLDELEAENQRLRERLEDNGGKDEKVAAIVTYADNARDGPAIKLTAKEIAGAADVSRRYAYDLMERLPEEYDWFLTPQEMRQYGSIEMDAEGRRLGVDFEGVHSTGVPLNLFTNGTSQEEGQ